MPPTARQINYLQLLLNDIGLDTRVKRNDFISNLLGFKIEYLDDIPKTEVSNIIEALKQCKESQVDYDPFNEDLNKL